MPIHSEDIQLVLNRSANVAQLENCNGTLSISVERDSDALTIPWNAGDRSMSINLFDLELRN